MINQVLGPETTAEIIGPQAAAALAAYGVARQVVGEYDRRSEAARHKAEAAAAAAWQVADQAARQAARQAAPKPAHRGHRGVDFWMDKATPRLTPQQARVILNKLPDLVSEAQADAIIAALDQREG